MAVLFEGAEAYCQGQKRDVELRNKVDKHRRRGGTVVGGGGGGVGRRKFAHPWVLRAVCIYGTVRGTVGHQVSDAKIS